uniref:Uncharacterized protein n=1 Tax=Rhizophora mucronata TaxID=61149 RepID=A0A2P2N229_RHIMU
MCIQWSLSKHCLNVLALPTNCSFDSASLQGCVITFVKVHVHGLAFLLLSLFFLKRPMSYCFFSLLGC